MMVVFPKVLVMIHSKMWLESDISFESSVSRLAERLYISYEEKTVVKNDYFYRDRESETSSGLKKKSESEFHHGCLRT